MIDVLTIGLALFGVGVASGFANATLGGFFLVASFLFVVGSLVMRRETVASESDLSRLLQPPGALSATASSGPYAVPGRDSLRIGTEEAWRKVRDRAARYASLKGPVIFIVVYLALGLGFLLALDSLRQTIIAMVLEVIPAFAVVHYVVAARGWNLPRDFPCPGCGQFLPFASRWCPSCGFAPPSTLEAPAPPRVARKVPKAGPPGESG